VLAFKLHGLIGITDIASDVVSGVSKLPLAKFINGVGRAQGSLGGGCWLLVVGKFVVSVEGRAKA